MAKRKYIKLVTDPLTAIYCWLDKPDSEGQFSNGRYKLNMLIPKDDPQMDRLREVCTQAAQEEWGDKPPANVNSPIKDGDEMADKAKEEGKDKEQFRGHYTILVESDNAPGLYGSGGKQLPEGIKIFSGDLVRVACAAGAYSGTYNGVKFYLNDVMLVEKRSMVDNNPFEGMDGFDPEDRESPFGGGDDTPTPAGINF